MLAFRRDADLDLTLPFRSAEEAWFWTMEALMARRDGAGASWRPEGPARPCEPDDVVRCLDTLYRQRGIELLHARILRVWGERGRSPQRDILQQRSDWRLWYQALGQLEWLLRDRGIVRWALGQFEYIPNPIQLHRAPAWW
jgi:hypothetical protein